MHATTFACPHCSAKLRVRERTFVGADIPCPECHQPIRLLADGPTGVKVQKSAPEAPAARAHARSAPSKTTRLGNGSHTAEAPAGEFKSADAMAAASTAMLMPPRSRAPWSERLRSPAGIAWTVATALAAIVLLFAVRPFTSNSTPNQPGPNAANSKEDGTAQGKHEEESLDRKAVPPAGPVTGESRLADLGRRLAEYEAAHGHFPRGTVYADGNRSDARFSWQAELAAEGAPDAAAPLWDQAWKSPLNDRFVRRGLAEYQNPAITALRSDDGYPATHFAGIAGVGTDAPNLPVDHPRAGVFGIERRTRLEDIKDGAANTMMVAGVRDQLGAWAAGGAATMRPLTKEPYINGPDGFGTGQADGMHVLMADGSVRFVSRHTDPRLLRRMAAMADGLPLDPAVPGEPGETSTAEPPARANELAQGPGAENDDEPGSPAVAEVPETIVPAFVQPAEPARPPIDVNARLSQPIRQFEQTKPVAARELFVQIEEMAGVAVKFDEESLEPAAGGLDKLVTVSLRNTTVGGLLETIVAEAGLAFVIEEQAIRILATPASGSRASGIRP